MTIMTSRPYRCPTVTQTGWNSGPWGALPHYPEWDSGPSGALPHCPGYCGPTGANPWLFEALPVPENPPTSNPVTCGSWPHKCPTHTAAVADGDMGECPFKQGSAAGGGDLLCFPSTLTLSLVSEKTKFPELSRNEPHGGKAYYC